jgi:hypothetical protein
MRWYLAIAIVAIASAAHSGGTASDYGNVSCGGYHCANPKATSPTPCKSDAECQLPEGAPIGGLPYICLPDVKLCGWKDLNKKPAPSKIEESK